MQNGESVANTESHNSETEKATQSATQQTTQQSFENQPKNQPQHKKYKEINITKLNNIFNLIIDNEYEKLNVEKMKWNGFKLWLKNLDLDANKKFIDFLEVEKQLEYKIILPTLLKLYMGAKRVYINKLNREHIFYKLLRAKEYRGNLEAMDDEQIKEFANYYLKCLENFIDGSDDNA